jgi:hypothetical protein
VRFVNTGYLVEGRTFAYFGFPGFYPGELLLLLDATRRRDGLWHTYVNELRLRPFLPLAIMAFVIWGVFESLRGYLAGYAALDALRGLATHYYPFFLFVGMGVSRSLSRPLLLRHFINLNILIGVASIVALWALADSPNLPWASNVTLVGAPALPCFTLLLAIALADRVTPRFAVSTLLAAIAVVLGPRASILGALVGGVVLFGSRWRKINKRVLFFLAGSGVLYSLIIFIIPSAIPDLGGRVGSLTPARVLSRVIATFDKDLAYSIAVDSGEDPLYLDSEAGTADWRRRFWNAAVDSLASPEDWTMGHGYGFSLGSLMPGELGYDSSIRTPHNFSVFLLAYTGITGLSLYGLVVIAFVIEVVRCQASLVKTAIMIGGVAVVVMALSGNLFETPFGAVPTYLTMGMLLQQARMQD